MESNTKKALIPTVVARRILAIPGASLRIAKLAGVQRSYVSMVLHRRKPASDRLLEGIHKFFELSSREVAFELAAHTVAHGLDRPNGGKRHSAVR